MSKGVSIIETILTLTLTLCISGVVLNAVAQSGKLSKKIATAQDRLEGIFHAVEMLKSDLLKCGMRLQEAAGRFAIPLFEETEKGCRMVMGTDLDFTSGGVFAGDGVLPAFKSQMVAKGRTLLIYNLDQEAWQWGECGGQSEMGIVLKEKLKSDFPENSMVIPTREIEYRFYREQRVLKRKVGRGTFQPLLENVTDFSAKFSGENHSVLYRIEINQKEQVRGFIFLANTVLT